MRIQDADGYFPEECNEDLKKWIIEHKTVNKEEMIEKINAKKKTHAFVRENTKDGRIEVIEFLEKKGYKLSDDEFRTKERIIEDILPISVDMNNKEYSMMGNVTCAAAAAQRGKILTKEQFFEKFKEL